MRSLLLIVSVLVISLSAQAQESTPKNPDPAPVKKVKKAAKHKAAHPEVTAAQANAAAKEPVKTPEPSEGHSYKQAGLIGKHGFVAFDTGIAIPTGSMSSSLNVRPSFDLSVLYRPSQFAFGGFINYNFGDVKNSPLGFNVTSYGVEAGYFSDCGFHGSLRIGIASWTVTLGGFSAGKNPFMLAPRVGYDFMLSDMVSLGPTVQYMNVFESNASFGFINVDAAVKIHF